MNAPTTLRAGNTIEWTDSHASYKASESWALTFYLRGPSSLDVSGVADGDAFDVTITAAQTAALTPGVYTIQGQFSKGTEKHTPDGFAATLEVLPDISAQVAGYEGRTHAQKTLDQIETTIETLVANPNAEAAVNGKSYTQKDLAALFRMKKMYEFEVSREADAERVAKGLKRKRILTRFDKAS